MSLFTAFRTLCPSYAHALRIVALVPRGVAFLPLAPLPGLLPFLVMPLAECLCPRRRRRLVARLRDAKVPPDGL